MQSESKRGAQLACAIEPFFLSFSFFFFFLFYAMHCWWLLSWYICSPLSWATGALLNLGRTQYVVLLLEDAPRLGELVAKGQGETGAPPQRRSARSRRRRWSMSSIARFAMKHTVRWHSRAHSYLLWHKFLFKKKKDDRVGVVWCGVCADREAQTNEQADKKKRKMKER